MAIGVNSLLGAGVRGYSLPNAHNAASNATASGRQAVRSDFDQAAGYVAGWSGHADQAGQGVDAGEVFRQFDGFMENAFLDKISSQERYQAEYPLLLAAWEIFGESVTPGTPGMADALAGIFSIRPSAELESGEERAELAERVKVFTSSVRLAADLLTDIERRVEGLIRDDVARANELMSQIVKINRDLDASALSGKNSANSLLMNHRNELMHRLAGIMDIRVTGRGAGEYTVGTTSGFTLVKATDAFLLEYSASGVITIQGGESNNATLEITGGSLAGYLDFNGPKLAEYRSRLTEFTDAAIREIAAADMNAADIEDLAVRVVPIGEGDRLTLQTLNDFYADLVATVRADASSCKYMADVEKAMVDELNDRRGEMAGINLDEKMGSLIKSQSAYKAAAKLVTTADQMLQALFALKL